MRPILCKAIELTEFILTTERQCTEAMLHRTGAALARQPLLEPVQLLLSEDTVPAKHQPMEGEGMLSM